jgi:hypothetical protein
MSLPPSVLGGVLQAAGSVAAKVRDATGPGQRPPSAQRRATRLPVQLTFGQDSFAVAAAQRACEGSAVAAPALDGHLCDFWVSCTPCRLCRCVFATSPSPTTRAQVPWGTRALLLPAVLVLNSYGMMLTLRGMAASGSLMGNVLALAANFVATVSDAPVPVAACGVPRGEGAGRWGAAHSEQTRGGGGEGLGRPRR